MTDHPTDGVQARPEDASSTLTDNIKYAGNVLAEFASSAWQSGAVNKVRGVSQLFDKDGTPAAEPEKELHGAMKLAHTAGAAAGEIFDLAVASSLIGKGFTALGGSRMLMGSSFGSLMENATARGIATGTTLGAVDGGLFTPVKEGESNWRRLGNAFTEAGTFAVMNGVAGHIGDSYGTNLAGRLKTNALSGGIAGVTNVNLDAWSHGKSASTEDMLMGGAGWAVGNMAFGEAANAFVKGASPVVNAFKSWRASPGAPDAAALGSAQLVPVSEPGVTAPKDAGARSEARSEDVEARKAFIEASETQSMSRLARQWGLKSDQALPETASAAEREALAQRQAKFDGILDEYYGKFEQAFPLPGEVESKQALRDRYLLNGDSTWDMVILRDADKNVVGGIHYQIVDVPDAVVMTKVAWAEHIFLRKDAELNARTGGNFGRLKNIAKDEIEKADGKYVAMEFNNSRNMSIEQREADRAAGLSADDRLWVWGRAGIHVPVDRHGNMPQYGQPDMDTFREVAQVNKVLTRMKSRPNETVEEAYESLPEAGLGLERMKNIVAAVKSGQSVEEAIAKTAPARDPNAEPEEEQDGSVRFLNLGFIATEPLTGRTVPTSDITKVARALHRTIPTVDVDTDPTVAWYSEANAAIKDPYLTMVPLTAIARANEVAKVALVNSINESVEAAVQRAIQQDIQHAVRQIVAGTSYLSPQELEALPGAMKAAAEASLDNPLKKK